MIVPSDPRTRTASGSRPVRSLLPARYLESRLPETDARDDVGEQELRTAFDAIAACWERAQRALADDRRPRLEETFVRPVFRILGLPFARDDRADRPQRRPDYGIFETEDDARDAFDSVDADRGGEYENAVAIADIRRSGRALDARGSGDRERDHDTPCYRLHAALQETPVRWGVLTNGRRWRLYDARTSHRLEPSYEIDLPAVLESDDLETFARFYRLFRHDAFLEDADGERFLDAVAEGAAEFRREQGKALEENAVDALEALARGFRRYPGTDLEEGSDEGDIETLYDASLTVIVRLLVALATERRRDRPVDPSEEGETSSGTGHRKRDGLRSLARSVAAELDDAEAPYSDRSNDLWSRLGERVGLLGDGERSDGGAEAESAVSAAEERPFRSDSNADDGPARFLATHSVGDASLATVLDLLTRRRDGPSDETAPIDYASLDGRRLGDVYEALLEYRLAVADEPLVRDGGEYVPAADDAAVTVAAGEVYLTADGEQRKTTGSYYTPPSVVEHVVDRTVGPLLEELRAEFDGADTDAEDGFAERVFERSILDPAMGTGHFLTCALEYVTREIVAAEDAAARRSPESGPPSRGVHELRSRVAARCLYGVDRDPLAAAIASASLRLRTRTADRPPGSFARHLKTGDALVGSDLQTLADCAPNAAGRLRIDRSDADPDGSAAAPAGGDEFGRGETEASAHRRRRLEAVANVHTAREFGLEVPDGAIERLVAALDADEDWAALARTDWFAAAQRRADAEGYFHWELEFPAIYFDEDGVRLECPGFDAVIGNPPWVATAGRSTISATIDADLRSYLEDAFSATENQFDLYVAFYERSIRLSRDGRVGLVVPDAILAREGNEPIRSFVLRRTALSEIVRVGTAFDGVEAGAVILVSGGDGTVVRCADATGDADLASLSYDPIPADVFEAADATRFLIYLDRETRSIRSTVAAHPPLGDFVTISRGEEISKRADALRERAAAACDGATRPIAPGSAVSRYGIDDDELRFVEPSDVEKAPRNYESPKLLVRQTSDSLVGTYDEDDLVTIKSVYNVHGDAGSPAELKHLLGALHSSALAFYHHYTHAAYRSVFPQINQSTLAALPVPMADGPDPELVAAVEKRLALTAERSAIDLHVPDYLGRDPDGPPLGDLADARRANGVEGTKLAATTEEWPNLRLGSVTVDSSDSGVVLAATVRYKPADAAVETDRWGYAETEPVPAVAVDADDDLASLVEIFVPFAVAEGDGIAGFRRPATKTISPLDRLEALRLPRLEAVEDGLRRYLADRSRAAGLEASIAETDRRIDDRACSLYGLTDAERAVVRREFGADG